MIYLIPDDEHMPIVGPFLSTSEAREFHLAHMNWLNCEDRELQSPEAWVEDLQPN